MASRSQHVAGAGLLALDVVIPEPARSDALAFAGGTCGNVLSILSFLRWTATPIGFIGNDPAGKRLLADFATTGIHTRHLIQRADSRTPVFIQRLERATDGRPRHNFSNATHCPHCGHLLAGKTSHAKVGQTPIRRFRPPEKIDVFFMDRLSDDILSLAKSARERGAVVFYEPSAKEDNRFWRQAFDLIDIVKYSADRFSSDELSPYLKRKTVRLWEIQTRGASGLRYRRHELTTDSIARWNHCEAISAPRVVDTCGAGDWCSAGLIHGLSMVTHEPDAASFARAVRFGQLLAAWACGYVGARGAMYCTDRQMAWQAIKSLLNSGQLDVSRLPLSADSTPHAHDDLAQCMAVASES